jgi:MATE family multidrug resistance protein
MHYSFPYYKPHYRKLIQLGIPIILGQLAMVLLGFFDTLMVGRYGTNELAAAAFVNSLMNFPIFIVMGMSMGMVPIIGAQYGRKDTTAIGRSVWNSLFSNGIATAIALLLLGIGYFSIDYMGQPKELLPLIKSYYVIQWCSIPFVALFYTCKQFTDSITDTKISMYIIGMGVGMNILLNYVLIYGIGPFPKWGLVGAGIATLISRGCMAILYAFVLMKHSKWSKYKEALSKAKSNKDIIRHLQKMGWPIALQMLMEGGSFSITTIFAGFLGIIPLAAHQVLISLSMLFFMLYSGLGSAISVRVSNFNGQNNKLEVRRSAMAGTHLMVIFLFINLTLAFLLRYEIGPFFSNSPEVAALIPGVILALMLYQVGDAIQIAYINALRGLGDVKPIVWVSFFTYLVLSIPLSYFLGIYLGYGLIGIWMAFPISLSVAAVGYTWRFYHKTR